MSDVKLTKVQERTYERATKFIEQAFEMDFQTWCWKSDFNGGGNVLHSYEDFERECAWFQKTFGTPVDVRIENHRTMWFEARNRGIAVVRANSATLRAMERKGVIEIVKLGGSGFDRIRLTA